MLARRLIGMLDLIDAEACRLYRDVLAMSEGSICAIEARPLELISMDLLRQCEANAVAGVRSTDTPETIAAIKATYAAMVAYEATQPIDVGMPYLVARRIAAAIVAELQRSMGIKGAITESPAAFGSARYVHVTASTGNVLERIHVALQVA